MLRKNEITNLNVDKLGERTSYMITKTHNKRKYRKSEVVTGEYLSEFSSS